MEIKYRKNREFEIFDDIEKIISILQSQFSNRKLYIKFAPTKTVITVNEFLDDLTVILLTDPNFTLDDDIIIVYGLSDKYVEIDFQILENKDGGYLHCSIINARIAASGRKDLRFKLESDEVYATNFRVSKQTIDVSLLNIPTSIKVVLDQFHHTNSKMSDLVKVDVFSLDTSNPILDRIRKTGKTLFIPDVSMKSLYASEGDDFIDLTNVYGVKLDQIIMKYLKKGYKSIIIVPIIYLSENEESIPFAYIQLISKTENFTLEKVLELKGHSFQLIDRLRDANTLMLSIHQSVVDISKGGAKLQITDVSLKKSIMKSKGFTFDLVFKLQAPITLYGEVKVTYVDMDGKLMVGVDFEGNSSRKGEMKRFNSIIKPMELEYKSRLIKSLKNKKD